MNENENDAAFSIDHLFVGIKLGSIFPFDGNSNGEAHISLLEFS